MQQLAILFANLDGVAGDEIRIHSSSHNRDDVVNVRTGVVQ